MVDVNESRPYVAHLRAEHRRLDAAVRIIQGLFPASAVGSASFPSGEQLRQRLIALRDELERHFAEEEQGGCIEEAVCRCPSLSPKALELRLQHPILLEQLQRIIRRSEVVESLPRGGEGVERGFADFAEKLRGHEDAENRILQQAFGSSFDFDEPLPV
jgi:hypothetical protein